MILLKSWQMAGQWRESKSPMVEHPPKKRGGINSLTLHIKGNIRREYFLCVTKKGNDFQSQGHLEYVNVCSAMSNVHWTAVFLTLLGLILRLTPLTMPLQ